jgi:hypothetical protein
MATAGTKSRFVDHLSFSGCNLNFYIQMSIKKGSVLYAYRDGINIYGEPRKDSGKILMTIPGKKGANFEWKQAARIGTATGQMATNAEGVWIEVTCELTFWRKRIVDWVREDQKGYLLQSENPFYDWGDTLPDPQADAPTNTPVSDSGTTGTGTTGNGTGTASTNTTLWVVVAVLALVAGFLGFKKLSK